MAKPYKNAALICGILTIVAVIGIIAGLATGSALLLLILLLPTIGYEVYRTEGDSTKLASWGLLLVYIAEIVLILFNVTFNFAEWLGRDSANVGGYDIPLGDVRMIGPIIMGLLSVVLFVRTRGIYTKWLSVIIIAVSLVTLYVLDPDIFNNILKFAVEEGIDRV